MPNRMQNKLKEGLIIIIVLAGGEGMGVSTFWAGPEIRGVIKRHFGGLIICWRKGFRKKRKWRAGTRMDDDEILSRSGELGGAGGGFWVLGSADYLFPHWPRARNCTLNCKDASLIKWTDFQVDCHVGSGAGGVAESVEVVLSPPRLVWEHQQPWWQVHNKLQHGVKKDTRIPPCSQPASQLNPRWSLCIVAELSGGIIIISQI